MGHADAQSRSVALAPVHRAATPRSRRLDEHGRRVGPARGAVVPERFAQLPHANLAGSDSLTIVRGMDEGLVGQVRSFNRTVTQRIGALDDAFLSRGRPLGQARLLWEIGQDGSDVRRLRSRLDLDSGYLSRLLRSLENDGLVAVEQSRADGRVRTARLTGRGLAERAELDRRSDDAATSILLPLGERQRSRLIAAMAEVERLLTASAVEVGVCDPRHPDARFCLRA